MMNQAKSKIILSIALALATSNAHAETDKHVKQFDLPLPNKPFIIEAEVLEKKLVEAGISPLIIKQAMNKYKAATASAINKALTNGDNENAEITCNDFGYGNFSLTWGTDCTNTFFDESNTTSDILFWYHPSWAATQKSLGEAFKFTRSEVAKANAIFAKNTPVKLRLVGFEQPTFAGYRDFQIEYFGQAAYDSLVEQGYTELPNSVDFNTVNSPKTSNGVEGLDSLIQVAKSFANDTYRGVYTKESLPTDAKKYINYGADISVWMRLPEPNILPIEAERCGNGGSNFAVLLLGPNDTETSQRCPFVLTHELGHGFMADHELKNKGIENGPNGQILRTRATAAPCGTSHTVMYYASGYGLQQGFSSPNFTVDGSVCGDESKMNNAKQVSIVAPYIANSFDSMDVIGDIWFSSNAITASESESAIKLEVTRNGDLTKTASVKVFIDNGYKLLSNDFIDVTFNSGESVKVITLNVINNDSTDANPSLVAELVTPMSLAVAQDKASLSITIANDDIPPTTTPTTPPVKEPTTDTSSSGGGSFGFLSLIALGFVRVFRK
jgi:hypothetical protein